MCGRNKSPRMRWQRYGENFQPKGNLVAPTTGPPGCILARKAVSTPSGRTKLQKALLRSICVAYSLCPGGVWFNGRQIPSQEGKAKRGGSGDSSFNPTQDSIRLTLRDDLGIMKGKTDGVVPSGSSLKMPRCSTAAKN